MNNASHSVSKAYRLEFASEWNAFVGFETKLPTFESLMDFRRKRDGSSRILLAVFGNDSEIPIFDDWIRSIRGVVKITEITNDEFYAAPSDHTWYEKKFARIDRG